MSRSIDRLCGNAKIDLADRKTNSCWILCEMVSKSLVTLYFCIQSSLSHKNRENLDGVRVADSAWRQKVTRLIPLSVLLSWFLSPGMVIIHRIVNFFMNQIPMFCLSRKHRKDVWISPNLEFSRQIISFPMQNHPLYSDLFWRISFLRDPGEQKYNWFLGHFK